MEQDVEQPAESEVTRVLRRAASNYSETWRSLVLTDLIYKAIAFILLTPLLGFLFRTLIGLSGERVLADVDIPLFFLGPAGWLCFLIAGSVWLTISALEMTSLLMILAGHANQQRLSVVQTLRLAFANSWPIVRLAARILGYVAGAALPFLAAAGFTYLALLRQHDINYYLHESPPEFLTAISIGAVLLLGLAGVVLWLTTGLFYALPILLFEENQPAAAVKQSWVRAKGRRIAIALWVGGWLVVMALISMAFAALAAWMGRLLTPESPGSLRWLTFAIGLTLLGMAASNQLVAVLGSTSLATIIDAVYRRNAQAASIEDTPRLTSVPAAALITTPRVLAAVVIGGILALLFGLGALQGVRVTDKVEIMAHRGASTLAPENTMAAVERAINVGADWVEIDVQENADGEVVVFHDSDFMKMAALDLKIWDATNAQLDEIDIGSWFSPEFHDQRTPRLAEVLAACRGKIRVNIELKYYGHDEQLEQRVAEIVESERMVDQIILMSLKRSAVRKMKSLRPDWRVGALLSVYAGDLAKLEGDFFAVNAAFASPAFIERAHDLDKEVYVWTVNDAATMSILISRGVDGLITDRPDLARRVLEQRSEMSPAERLLLEMAPLLTN